MADIDVTANPGTDTVVVTAGTTTVRYTVEEASDLLDDLEHAIHTAGLDPDGQDPDDYRDARTEDDW